jgi:sugar phosphate isomerase/epimerase
VDRHWDAYCGLSLVHFLAFPACQNGRGPILDTVARVADDDFFSGIEISRVEDSTLRKQVGQLIAQTHLKVDFGAHPMILGEKLNLNSLVSSERAKARQALQPLIDQANDLGARRFVLLSGPDPGDAQRRAATEALIESLKELCTYARKSGISVVLETFDRKVDKKALIGPAEEAAAVAAAVKEEFPDFGLLYDMGHMVLLDETPLPALRTLKGHLAHVHVGNCVKVPGRPGYGDLHPRFGFPGSANDVPELAEFLEALFQIGYLSEARRAGCRPSIGFEVRPQPGEDSSVIIANLKRAWRQAWPLVRASKIVN